MIPERIQLSRAKGWRKPDNTVVVSRPSKWGNPWRIDQIYGFTALKAVEKFRIDLESTIADPWGSPHSIQFRNMAESLGELRGKNLACWCPIGQHGEYVPCHADVLLELANGDNLPCQ